MTWTRRTILVAVLAFLGSLAACGDDDNEIQTNCTYRDINGTCTITSVQPGGPDIAACTQDASDSSLVYFDFTPEDTTEQPDTHVSLHVGVGTTYDPPNEFLNHYGLTEGSQHPCTKKVIEKGTCTPVIYEFRDVDLTKDYRQYCQ